MHASFLTIFVKDNVYIGEEQVKVQMELIRTNKETFKNLPDLIFSFVDVDGEVIGNALKYIRDQMLLK